MSKTSQQKEKTALDQGKTEVRRCQKNERNFSNFSVRFETTSTGQDTTPKEESTSVKEQRREASYRGSRFCSSKCTHTSSHRAPLFFFERESFPGLIVLTWTGLLYRINVNLGIQIKCVNTYQQIADVLIQGSFSLARWSQLTPHVQSDTTSAREQPFFGFLFVRAQRRQDVATEC